MRRITLFKKWIGLAAAMLLLGCYDYSNFDNVTIDPVQPHYVLPVVDSKISFKDLAERSDANTVITQKPGDTKYYLTFVDSMKAGFAEDEFTVPPFSLNYAYQLDAGEIPPIPLPAGQTLGPINKELSENYTPDADAEIKLIKLSQGSLTIRITNNFSNIINGTITLNSLLNPQGSPMVINLQNINPSQSFLYTINDLTNYSIYLYNGSTYNTFTINASITITSLGNPISTSNRVEIEVSGNNLDFNYITGNVNKTIGIPDKDFDVDIFRSARNADLMLTEPTLKLKIYNSYGIPIALNVNSFEATNNDNQTVYLANEGTPPPSGTLLIGSPNYIKYLTDLSQTVVEDSLKLNPENSNIEDVLGSAPKQFKLRSSVDIGNSSSYHDYFIKKNSFLKVVNLVEIPLEGWVERLEILDTLDVDLPDLYSDLNLANDNSLKLTAKFRFVNGIPLRCFFQVYFINDLNQVLTQLYDSETLLLESADIGNDGKVSQAKEYFSSVEIDQSKYDLMKDATKMVFRVRFQTGGTTHQTVVIESTNDINIQMSIGITGTISTD